MPQIDVTTSAAAAANTLSDMAGGFVQGHALATGQADRRQARADDVEYRDMLLKARNREMGQLAMERDRHFQASRDDAAQRAGFEDRRLKLYEAREAAGLEEEKDVEEAGQFVAQMTERTFGAGTVAQFEEERRAQRAEALKFASGVGPRARALILTQLDDDERAERASLAQRAAKTAWESAATNPLLADGAGMSEEIKALAMENIEALETGAESPAQSMRDLEELRGHVRKKLAKAKDFEWGIAFAQNEIAQGGGDTEAMHMALADFETLGPDQASLPELKRRVLRAKHSIELDTVKLGRVEIPKSIKVGTPEWREIAESAADEELLDLMGKDPLVKHRLERGDFDDEKGMQKYEQMREGARKKLMRRYAAQSGATRTQMQSMGLLEDGSKIEKQSLDAIRKRLEAAGIDPDMKIPGRGAVTPAQKRMAPGDGSPAEKPPLGAPGNPMLHRLKEGTQAANDEVYGEEDIEAIYGDGE